MAAVLEKLDGLAPVVVAVRVAGVPGFTEFGLIEQCGAICGEGDTEQESVTELPTAPLDLSKMVEGQNGFGDPLNGYLAPNKEGLRVVSRPRPSGTTGRAFHRLPALSPTAES